MREEKVAGEIRTGITPIVSVQDPTMLVLNVSIGVGQTFSAVFIGFNISFC